MIDSNDRPHRFVLPLSLVSRRFSISHLSFVLVEDILDLLESIRRRSGSIRPNLRHVLRPLVRLLVYRRPRSRSTDFGQLSGSQLLLPNSPSIFVFFSLPPPSPIKLENQEVGCGLLSDGISDRELGSLDLDRTLSGRGCGCS